MGGSAPYTFLTPLFGILAGAGLLGERVSPALILALVFVALGIRLVNAQPPAVRLRPVRRAAL